MSEPTRDERIAALAVTTSTLHAAAALLSQARSQVVPSSPRNVLDRPANYDFQRAISAAEDGVRDALTVSEHFLRAMVPRRCEWPGGHLGPWKHVEPFEHVQRCEACGEEIGK